MAANKELVRYYALAQAELRNRHDAEFHEILQAIYAENNVDVIPRGSRAQQRQRRIERQEKLLKELKS